MPCGLRPGRGPWGVCHGVDATADVTDDANSHADNADTDAGTNTNT